MRNFSIAFSIVMILVCISLSIGAAQFSLFDLFHGDPDAWNIFLVTRLPRTLALILSGVSMAMAGTIMQLLTRNRFVEPATAGTMESASLGLLVAMIFAPSLPVSGKMLCAICFAALGTGIFLQLLKQVPLYSILLVPLIGLILGGIIRAITLFFAYRYDMVQSLLSWTSGDFSSVMQGRYEFLWLAAPLACFSWYAADRFTIASLGKQFSITLGIPYYWVMIIGLLIVAVVSTVVVVTIGQIPFLGLIVPNMVALLKGDNMRKNLPWIAFTGSALVLFCDILSRLIHYPYEIPIGIIMGILGGIIFLYLILSKKNKILSKRNQFA